MLRVAQRTGLSEGLQRRPGSHLTPGLRQQRRTLRHLSHRPRKKRRAWRDLSSILRKERRPGRYLSFVLREERRALNTGGVTRLLGLELGQRSPPPAEVREREEEAEDHDAGEDTDDDVEDGLPVWGDLLAVTGGGGDLGGEVDRVGLALTVG